MDRAPDSAEPLRLILRLVSRLKRRALRLLERPADARDVLRDAETFCDLAERATGRMRTFLREGGPPPVPSGDSSDGSDVEAVRDAPLPLADGSPPTPPRPEGVDGSPPSEGVDGSPPSGGRTIAVVGGETVKVPGDVDVDSFTSCKAVAVPFPSRFFEEHPERGPDASLDEVRRPKPASASEKAPFLRCVSMSKLLEPSAVRARSDRRRSRARRPTPPTVVLSSDSESERAVEADAAALDGLKRDIMLGRVTPRVRLARFPTGDAGLKKLLEKSGTAAAYGVDGELLAGDPLRAKIAEIKRSLVLSSDTDGERPRARSRSSSAREDASSSTGSASSLRQTRPTRKRISVLGSDLDEEVGRTRLKKNYNDRSKGNSIMKTGKRSRKKEDTLYDMIVNGKPDIVENNNSADSDSNDSNSQMKSVQSKPAAEKSMLRFTSDLLDDDSSSGVELTSKTNGDTSITEPSKQKMEGKKNKSDTSGSEEITRKKEKTKVLSNSDDEESNDNSRKSTKKNDSNASVKDSPLRGSDSENSDIFKPKRKRKSKTSDESSEDMSSSEKINTKKRRRIKNVSGEDSELSGSDNGSGSDGGADSSKRGRKNIRKVKRSGNLDEATRTAARKEKERIHRIAERQRLYNESMFDESARPDEVVKLEKVVLDFDPVSKQPIISVDRGLVEKLKPHQGNGIKFMWDACFESVKQIKESKGSGCILAHCMGLGKTLQVVTLVHTLMTHQKFTKVERVLVVCPLSTVLNWVNEFKMWLKFAKCKDDFEIYEISRYKQNYERSNKLKEWLEEGGVCVLGYDMFRNLSADNNKKFRKAQLSVFQRALVDPGPDLVVCDEGHLLKNEKTSLSQSMNRVKTLRRIVLTGTPLQNNLKEYYCMVQFVKPDLLGKYNEYLNRFVNPITNGQYTDSTEHDIRIMKRRSHVLHTMLDGAVQRRDYSVLAPFLPPKHEYVLFISLTEIQIKLYSHYMDNYSRRPQPDRKSTGFLFPDFQSLQRIWTHPLVLKANSERYEILQQKKREKEEEDSEGSLVDFIDDDESTTSDESTSEDQSDENSDDSDQRSKKKNKPKKSSHKRVTRATAAADGDDVVEVKVVEPPRLENPTEWWMSLCSEDELDDIRHSNKLTLLLDIIKMCDAIGDKLLVFSQSLYSLDLIEQFLWKIDEATQKGEENQKLSGHLGSWSPGLDYFRLDGSANCENRAIWCKLFNREDNPRARLFLISTRAGGLGINLVAANRVVIFDMSWNPSHDVQSIFRVYRFGQKKPCYIYRFLALGTMEEKIYERQVTKQAISKRVIDEQQIDRHYAESDLAELYTFCPIPEGQREVPKLPKDRLFADLLQQHDKMIYKYHEHDSLLENKEEETLTEEERKAAWEDYENEKTRPPSSFGGQILAGFQQQQHHLAMSALLQQDYPGLTEQQIASMVPAVLQQMYQNGDSVLMQKMNAMIQAQNSMLGFKYPQNPMMNPNLMLNPANMASSGGAGGTMSNFQQGWQQQQQLQLQRIQQQQAMQANLKYYAGGLGSRDTVDMAALQQRQRAMMLASNPTLPQRGRPPKQSGMMAMGSKLSLPLSSRSPIPPATISSDIVDLDSE